MKNNILKKILSLFIVLAVFPVGIHVYASDIYTQADIRSFNDNVSLLHAFELIEDDSREMATTVTRGEFASIMMKYLQFGSGTDLSGENNEKTFSDVNENAKDIYGIVSLGIMSGYSEDKFAPENNILFEEALKSIVAALGWSEIAEREGGYPTAYINIANRLELTEGVYGAQGSILTYYDIVQMLVNALSAEIYIAKTPNMEMSPQSWFSSRLKADKEEGTVTGFNAETDSIAIDYTIYNTENDYTDMLGCHVEFYVDDDDNVIYVCDDSKERLTFNASLIDDYSEKTYSIYKEENALRTHKFRLLQDVNIFYNGVHADNLSIDDMVPKYGRVTLIGNNSDNTYDSVLIESYEIYTVINVDIDNEKIICLNSEGKPDVVDVSIVGADRAVLVNSSGKPINFEDIPSDAVLRVGFSGDKKDVKIIVSEKSVKGSIVSVGNNDDYMSVNIDGVEYKTISNFPDGDKLKAGLGGTFYLDNENLIAAVKLHETGWQYGYLMNAYHETGEEEKVFLKIFNSSEESVVLQCREKTKIDGMSGKRGPEVELLLKKGTQKVQKQKIRYRVNGEGLVMEIDTPYNSIENMAALPQNGESPDSLRLVFAKTNAHYSKALYSFEGKINVLRTTPVFSIPGDDEQKYHVKAASVFANDKRYGIEAYSDSENSSDPCFLYMSKSLNASGDDTVGIVSEVITAIDPEDEIRTRFSVETYSGYMKLYYKYDEEETPVELDEGDVISFKYEDEYADHIKILYDYETGTCPNGNSSGGFGTSQLHYMFGNVYSKSDNGISVTTADIINGVIPTSDQLEAVYAPAFKIFKCSAESSGRSPVITQAAMDDIIDYKSGADNCSQIFISTDWQWPRIIVIYQRG
ncbi:MAG: S-layer homology domain-containing protein [Clostridia bacterium]|nr:S-layer homology domain-containing protein [Clostridia bacterium]